MRIHENDEIQGLIDELEDISIIIKDQNAFLQHLEKLEKIADENNDIILKLVTTYHKSDIPYINGDMAKCQKYIREALNLAKEIDQTYYLLRCYNTLAILDSESVDYYSSISHYLKALNIANLHPEYQYSAILLNNIGNLFVWMNEHEKALDYLLEATEKYAIENNDKPLLMNIIVLNIIEEYSLLKQYDEVDKWLQFHFEKDYEEINQSINVILTINEIDILYGQNDFENIHKKLDIILNDNLKYDNYIYIFRSYARLLDLSIQAKDKKTADLTMICMDAIDKKSHIKTFKYDYVTLKYQYYQTFIEKDDDGLQAKEILKEYFNNTQNVIEQLRNTYTRRLIIESELSKVRYEKENAEKYNYELQKDIELDYFTKILNKVSIEKYINKAIESSDCDAKHALLLIDIDYFKDVNDNYGHDYGDEIILSVVDMINSCCSENILFGRFGGDEFILFIKSLRNKSFVIEFVNEILEKARHIKIKEESFLTLSAGIYFVQKNDNFSTAFNHADEALYKTKRNGRDNFTIY